MKTLAIFDVDGTLVNTGQQDCILFAKTINEVFSINMPLLDRSDFKTSTDSGLISELIDKKQIPSLSEDDIEKFKETFFHRIKQFLAGDEFTPVPGALNMLSAMHSHPAFNLAIATGGWQSTAKLKLHTAGFRIDSIPFASAEVSIYREDIIKKAIELAELVYGVNYQKCIYIGDKAWDFHAAQELGIDFVGVGEQFYDLLPREKYIKDYSDLEKFYEILG